MRARTPQASLLCCSTATCLADAEHYQRKDWVRIYDGKAARIRSARAKMVPAQRKLGLRVPLNARERPHINVERMSACQCEHSG